MPALEPDLTSWLGTVTDERPSSESESRCVLATVAFTLAEAGACDPAGLSSIFEAGCGSPVLARRLRPLPDHAGPGLLGLAYEGLRSREARRATGVFYTPPALAREVVRLALEPSGETSVGRVFDPAVGGGAFLLAAADALAASGVPRIDVLDRLQGTDIDPLAVAVTRASLALWTGEASVDETRLSVTVGDGLAGVRAAGDEAVKPVDLVVGNPPFLGQLKSGTTRSAVDRERLRDRFGAAVDAYTDTSSLFLLAGLDAVGPGGVVALLQPRSFLVARHARGVREALGRRAALDHLWLDAAPLFQAGVRVCVPVLRRLAHEDPSGRDAVVTRSLGLPARLLAPVDLRPDELAAGPTWGRLSADVIGVPALSIHEGPGRLGDWCEATAGFRDQFYGLVPFVTEADCDDPIPAARLITSGSIDVARCRWGEQPTRFAKRRWERPVVDLDALTTVPSLHAWIGDRLQPKIVVATQTRVIEGAVDERGDWVPSVPTIAVTPTGADLWEVAAVLLSPPASAWALTEANGGGLAVDHVRLSAKGLKEIPLPRDRRAVPAAGRQLRLASRAIDESSRLRLLADFGRTMCTAYGVGADVLTWWRARLR